VIETSLAALAERLSADPTDTLTVQAVADWIEERGGECAPLRCLTAEDGDVIVYGMPENATQAHADQLLEVARQVQAWFAGRGIDTTFLVLNYGITIRQMRIGTPKKPA